MYLSVPSGFLDRISNPNPSPSSLETQRTESAKFYGLEEIEATKENLKQIVMAWIEQMDQNK